MSCSCPVVDLEAINPRWHRIVITTPPPFPASQTEWVYGEAPKIEARVKMHFRWLYNGAPQERPTFEIIPDEIPLRELKLELDIARNFFKDRFQPDCDIKPNAPHPCDPKVQWWRTRQKTVVEVLTKMVRVRIGSSMKRALELAMAYNGSESDDTWNWDRRHLINQEMAASYRPKVDDLY